ncbi:PAS domain-containing protein [Aurantimonas sp. 22II-16-19i]|uniref:PAS domain-containing protein n=1 Tax=Aurantimonas sp. 22II-16-19i TaxID=1317114 RepID=UPI0009F7FDE9|nr:PAS domain-containing protein [Aurantimonas sp. 22II-16-19i]ORE97523.1 two-component sensor histidine kinase [Aurantimonas sp. 22II-16-19i]
MFWSCLVFAILAAVAGFVGGVSWERRRDRRERTIDRVARRIVEGMPAQGWAADPDGNFTYINPVLAGFYGLGEAFFLLDKNATPDFDAAFRNLQKTVLHPDDFERTSEAWRRCRAEGTHFSNEHRVRRADGVYRWIRAAANPARDAKGRIVAWYGTSLDIDDLKKTELALQQREQALQRLIDTVPVHIWCADPDGEPTYMNERLRSYLGLTVEDFDPAHRSRLAQIVATVVHPDDAAAVEREVRRSAEAGTSFVMEYRQRRSDGAYRWIEGRSEPLKGEDGAVLQRYGICIDIDDRKRADETLRQRERDLQQIVDTVPVQIWCMSPDGETLYFNKRLQEYIGIAPEALPAPGRLAQTNRAVIHPDDLAVAEASLLASLQTGASFAMRFRVRRADGVYRWSDNRAEPLRDEDGTIIQWYGLCLDVDEVKQAEDALRQSEGAYREIIDTLPAMIWSVRDYDGPAFFNKTLFDVTNYRPDEQAQNDLASAIKVLVHPDDYPALRVVHERDFRAGIPVTHRFRVRQADGSYRWFEGRSASRRDGAGNLAGRYGILIDVDSEVSSQLALRRLQDRLAGAMQAASLAELSASIAHEVNQPLAAIVANAHACQRWLGADAPNIERARITTERVIRDAHAAADVVGRVRALFKQSTQTRTTLDINQVLGEACTLMADDARAAGIAIVTDLDPGIPSVDVDRVQVQQVLINLIRNGIEAMESGRVTGRTVAIRSRLENGELVVEVRDEGPGIEDPDRIFDAFFTTKQGGMGMGLSICRSIVEAHRGRLWAICGEPRGTIVRFALPLQAAAVS